MLQEQIENAGRLVPADIAELLGRPPLVHGEDPAQYQALLGRFAAAIGPADIIEWVFVKDLADAVWDVLRLRRWKSATVNRGAKTALAGLISMRPGAGHKHFVPDADSVELAEHWFTDGPHKNHVNTMLERYGLDSGHSVAALSAVRSLETLEILDALLSAAERRYGRTLQEIGTYRAEWRQKLRSAAGAVIDAAATDARSRRNRQKPMSVANETGKPAATRGAAGPRSRAGKKRPSAFKHGLAGAVPFALRAEVERLAARFARNSPDEGRRAMAAMAAEAELELRRVEEAKCALVDAAFSAAGAASGDAAEAEAIAAAATSLLPFRRYEAQARARRRRALQFL